MSKAMEQVKALTPRGTHMTLEKTLKEINRWYRGWSSYFAMTQYPAQLSRIEAHIRRRLRSRLIDQQKSKRNLYYKLVKRGAIQRMASKVYSNNKRWALSNAMAVTRACSNHFFVNVLGQYIRSDKRRPHWFEVNRWIKQP